MNPDFTKSADGLIPAIIQDNTTQKVLMLGYMSSEALAKTLETKKVTFFSRSKNRLWTKGEESGNFLNVVDIKLDCDKDTLLIYASPVGPVCHTGSDTCFEEENKATRFIYQLETIIEQRINFPTEGSYVNKMFNKGINKMAQKVGEEAVETVIEAVTNNNDLFLEEASDLLFHYLLLLKAKGKSLKDIEMVLEKRHK